MSDTELLDWLIKQDGIDWRWIDPCSHFSGDTDRERLEQLIRSKKETEKVQHG